MPNVLFRLSQIRVGDRAEVMVRFYASKFDRYGHTRVYVPIKYWNEKERRLSYSTRYYTPEVAEVAEQQKTLDKITSAILDSYVHTPVPGDTWLQDVIDRTVCPDSYESRSHNRMLVADACRSYPSDHTLSRGTEEHYEGLARLLDRYANFGHPLYVGDVTTEDLDDLCAFLSCEVVTTKTGKEKVVVRGHNTISFRLKKMRAVLRWCKTKKYTDNCPFDDYTIPEEYYGIPIFLNLKERDCVMNLEGLPKVLELVRDIFIFQCLVGCRVGDLYEFTADNITKDGFIIYKQNKVQDTPAITVPLLPKAIELLEKYAGQDPNGRIFPFVAEQTYNEYLKRVLEIADITREVIVYDPVTLEPHLAPLCTVATSHLARRTFMGNMFKKTRSESITTSFTGHKNGSRAIKRYMYVDDEMKQDLIQLVDTGQSGIPEKFPNSNE